MGTDEGTDENDKDEKDTNLNDIMNSAKNLPVTVANSDSLSTGDALSPSPGPAGEAEAGEAQ